MELRGASFRYEDGDAGVEGVDLVVRPGECVVLTGPSGSGKTTVTRLVNGLAPAYWHGELAGEVRIGGADAAALPLWERGRAVASVFQDPASQFFSFELAGEVAFACENYGMPTREIVERTDACIAAFDLERVRDRPLDALSSGEKQRVAVASAVAPGSRVLVCDEPTANLDADGAALLASQVAQLKAAGCAVLVSEHRLAWLAGIADRYAYLEGGRVRWQRSASEMEALSAGERERFGLRSASAVALPELARPEDARTSAGGTAPSLEARRLACRRGGHTIWEDVSFRAWPGQVVALTGRNGAGKSTLARVLAGLARQSAGEVLVEGRALRSGRSAPPGVLRRERHGDAVFHQQRFRRVAAGARARRGVDRPRPRYAGAAGAHAFQGRASRDALRWAAPAPRLGVRPSVRPAGARVRRAHERA